MTNAIVLIDPLLVSLRSSSTTTSAVAPAPSAEQVTAASISVRSTSSRANAAPFVPRRARVAQHPPPSR